jgi:lysophospholipase L1-like esterase
MKYIIVAVFVVLILLTLPNKSTKMNTLLPHNTILALGDSLTYGHGANHNESYPALLASLSGHKVINAGLNGETSDEGLQRLPKLLEDKSIKLMILCFGGNDILRKKSMASLKQNLKTMIQLAKAKNIDVLLISVPDISLFGLSSLELYEEVAEEEEVPLVSGILAEILGNPTLKSDQIHPNTLGYKLMADKIYESLRENGWVKGTSNNR